MSNFIQTNTIKEKLQCPKCDEVFFIFKHKSWNHLCRCCGWNGSFFYPDVEGET